MLSVVTSCGFIVLQCSLRVHFNCFFKAEDGIRDRNVTGVQTCALPIYPGAPDAVAAAVSGDRDLRFRGRLGEPVHRRGGEMRGDRAERASQAGDHCLLLPRLPCASQDKDVPGLAAPALRPDAVVDLALAQARPAGLSPRECTPLPGRCPAGLLVRVLLGRALPG